jgi:hypothetical protein
MEESISFGQQMPSMAIPEGDTVPETRDEILTLDEEATEDRRSRQIFSNGCTTDTWVASASMKRMHKWHLIVKASSRRMATRSWSITTSSQTRIYPRQSAVYGTSKYNQNCRGIETADGQAQNTNTNKSSEGPS